MAVRLWFVNDFFGEFSGEFSGEFFGEFFGEFAVQGKLFAHDRFFVF